MTAPDFSKPRKEPLRFTIDGDEFACAATLPAAATNLLVEMAALGDDPAAVGRQLGMIGDLLDMVLTPESAELFAARTRDPVRPIDYEQIGQVVKWLTEQYAARPTMPSTPSAGGRDESGISSTDGALPSAVG